MRADTQQLDTLKARLEDTTQDAHTCAVDSIGSRHEQPRGGASINNRAAGWLTCTATIHCDESTRAQLRSTLQQFRALLLIQLGRYCPHFAHTCA
jgi:hypothetical protein